MSACTERVIIKVPWSKHMNRSLTCPGQMTERRQRRSWTVSLHHRHDSYQYRTWGTVARPGDNSETLVVNHVYQVCHSRHCGQAVLAWAPWLYRTRRCVPLTVHTRERESHSHTNSMDWIGLSSVLRPIQHSIGYTGDGFTGQKTQPTVSKYWRRKQ